MILIYIYDGTFEGFLTSIYEAFYSKDKPAEIVSRDDFTDNMLYDTIIITTDSIKADKVLEAIKNKISLEALHFVFYVFLSSVPGSDTLLYNYIKLGFKLKGSLNDHLQNDIVLNVQKISKKVSFEKHNMMGFIRFKKLDNSIYYSSIEPDHNILALIAPHFALRLANQKWIIHDLKREIAAIYNLKEWAIISLNREWSIKLNSKNGGLYENLWKEYYEAISIKERKNPRLQKRLMPARYWKHLTEMH